MVVSKRGEIAEKREKGERVNERKGERELSIEIFGGIIIVQILLMA